MIAEHFEGSKGAALAVADEVLTLLEKIQQQQDFVKRLEQDLKEREPGLTISGFPGSGPEAPE